MGLDSGARLSRPWFLYASICVMSTMVHVHFHAPQPQDPLMCNKFGPKRRPVRSRAVQCVAQKFSAEAPMHCLVAASRVAQCGSARPGAFCAASMAGRSSSSEMKGHEND